MCWDRLIDGEERPEAARPLRERLSDAELAQLLSRPATEPGNPPSNFPDRAASARP